MSTERSTVWLIGAGQMARDHFKALTALGVSCEVIGRSERSAAEFESSTGANVSRGGLEAFLDSAETLPSHAIVCTDVESLARVTTKLLQAGLGQILVEKPAGLSPFEVGQLHEIARTQRASVFVAYNRRFYASTQRARQLIAEDGGVSSFHFEFTEWAHVIRNLAKPKSVKEQWFFCNSTHVVDLAFYLGGAPREMSCYVSGGLDWHPSASAFAGAGVSMGGALFSYHANWAAPGRWSVEVLTNLRRFVFRPLERLQVQQLGSVSLEEVEIDDSIDREFKPGILLQLKDFLGGNHASMCSLDQQNANLDIYNRIACDGNAASRESNAIQRT